MKIKITLLYTINKNNCYYEINYKIENKKKKNANIILKIYLN